MQIRGVHGANKDFQCRPEKALEQVPFRLAVFSKGDFA